MSIPDVKRLFFGFEVDAAWIHPLPGGRILSEENRHMTLAFLGNQSISQLQNELEDFPCTTDRLGLVGRSDHFLFLPKARPHVVAAHIEWFDQKAFLDIQQELAAWLVERGYKLDPREYLPHVTIARGPFHIHEWKEAFYPFPLIAKSLNLYESMGDLNYHSVWRLPFISPIEEIEHTADIAFQIRGKDLQQLFLHAQIALAFKFPLMLDYISEGSGLESLDDVIIHLNKTVSRADSEVGCPFKAISFHGTMANEKNGILLWEMIVDV